MPPRRAFTGLLARTNVKQQKQGVLNAPNVQPQGEVTNVEYREVIWMLSQEVTNKVAQQQESR